MMRFRELENDRKKEHKHLSTLDNRLPNNIETFLTIFDYSILKHKIINLIIRFRTLRE